MFDLSFKIATIIVLFFFLIISGCTQEAHPITPSKISAPEIDLENALGTLGAVDDIEMTIPLDSIIYIKGINVSIQGTAEEWIIGINDNNKVSFYIYNKYGISKTSWIKPIPNQNLPMHAILYPEDLFKKRPLFLQDITNGGMRKIDEIEIYNNTYYLILKLNSSIKEYRFNAITGNEV
ncbi:MAG TPA: hypothetical protein PLN56_10495 [Methanoregulaceae archaeon]|nr:hypothetical protein [Methanoregulaceae archaeon]HRU80599.1 hypothetical protein [Methanolinea sp.]